MIDTIVCDKQAEQAAVALLGDGNVKEIEFVNEARAAEGSIYLGKSPISLNWRMKRPVL